MPECQAIPESEVKTLGLEVTGLFLSLNLEPHTINI